MQRGQACAHKFVSAEVLRGLMNREAVRIHFDSGNCRYCFGRAGECVHGRNSREAIIMASADTSTRSYPLGGRDQPSTRTGDAARRREILLRSGPHAGGASEARQ